MQLDISGTVGRAVADYTGGRVLWLECAPDPHTPAFAFRALVKVGRATPRYAEFLVTNTPLQDVTAADLAEVEFTTWPPSAIS
jgi:hypothetical protein